MQQVGFALCIRVAIGDRLEVPRATRGQLWNRERTLLPIMLCSFRRQFVSALVPCHPISLAFFGQCVSQGSQTSRAVCNSSG